LRSISCAGPFAPSAPSRPDTRRNGVDRLAGLAAVQVIGAAAPPSSVPSDEVVDSTAQPSGPAPSDYVVEPGDTLWSIAVHIAPDQDPRPIVHRLAERSGGTALRPGQRLSLAGIR
jgi:LysM repeat protein